MKIKQLLFGLILSPVLTLILLAGDQAQPPAEQFIVAPAADYPRANPPYIVLTSSNRYSFNLPIQWNIRYDGTSSTITLKHQRRDSSITIVFDEKNDASPVQDWIENLKNKFSPARIDSDFQLTVLGTKAQAVDLAWSQTGQMKRAGRFARGPLHKGFIEFSMICEETALAENLPVLMQLMLSFDSAPLDKPLPLRVHVVE